MRNCPDCHDIIMRVVIVYIMGRRNALANDIMTIYQCDDCKRIEAIID